MREGERSTVHRIGVTPADQAAGPYLYLPFEVPEGATRIDVLLEHDEGNVIDLGLLDPRAGAFPAREGFRGWSGGARDRFFIATDDATPGYLPGPLPKGEWRVVLGLYRVRPEGCRITVHVDLDREDRATIAAAPSLPSFPLPSGWYPGDLQSHTFHSDAKGTIEDLAAAARHRGLRFLAVTDHNTTSHHRHLPDASDERLLLLPGEEVTTADGHANVWGARGWVDFRITRPDDVARVVEEAHSLGGIVSINHPKPGGPDWRYPVPDGIDCVEAWQAPWPAGNDASLAFYDRILRSGRRAVLVGGSDRHQPGWPDTDPHDLQVGSPTTWLWLDELSLPACMHAIRSGNVFVSESPEGPFLAISAGDTPMGGTMSPRSGGRGEVTVHVHAEYEVELRLVGGAGVLTSRPVPASAVDAPPQRIDLELDLAQAAPFVRAELRRPRNGRVVALSNPVFLAW